MSRLARSFPKGETQILEQQRVGMLRGSATTCEECLAIDVRAYARQGLLRHGNSWRIRWYRGDRELTAIRARAWQSLIELSYYIHGGGSMERVRQEIALTYTDQHFGGRRVWFECPGCGRRCAKLYAGNRFLCRLCHGLRYESDHPAPAIRPLLQARKIRDRLGATGSLELPFPDRPKRMRRTTYDRLREKGLRYEAEALDASDAWLSGVARLLQGIAGDRPN